MPPRPSCRTISYRCAKVVPEASPENVGKVGAESECEAPDALGLFASESPAPESSQPHWGQRRNRGASPSRTLKEA